MTQEEIIEYNKMCAEFLGMYDYSKDNEFFDKGKHFCYPEKDKNPGSGYYTIVNNTSDGYCGIFNSDWNWIMEVVNAIEKLKYVVITKTSPTISETWIQCIITIQNCTVDSLFNNKFIVEYKSDYSNNQTKKEAVVQAINQFLIWYNENSRNQKL